MKNNFPKVSVLIPSFNYATYIAQAIDSILSQTFRDFEIIIIDNNSTDNTVEIVNKYLIDERRISLIVNSENIGMTANWNKCLDKARGEYIKFLNSDDFLSENNLKILVDTLDKDKSISLVTSWKQNFGLNSELVVPPYRDKVSGKRVIEETLSGYRNWIGEPSSVMFRRSDVPTEGFNTKLHWLPDWDMWLRLLLKGDLYIVPKVLCHIRIHDKQATVSLKKSFFTIFEEYEYYHNVLQENKIFNLQNHKELVKFMALQLSLELINLIKMKNYKLVYEAMRVALREGVVSRLLLSILQRNIQTLFIKNRSFAQKDDVSFLLKKIELEKNKKIIFYGFNNLCEKVYEKSFKDREVVAIVDGSKYGYQFQNIIISRLEDIELDDNFLFVITAMNERYIKEIKKVIVKKFTTSKIISL